MLRNIVQAAFCGLILFGCSNTSPLIKSDLISENKFLDNIKIYGDVCYAYRLNRMLQINLASYYKKLLSYRINIYLTEELDNINYSEKKVIKDQVKIIYKIEILDQNRKELLCRSMDSLSTYEVEDNAPFASIASKNQATSNIINDIANNVSLIIIDFLN